MAAVIDKFLQKYNYSLDDDFMPLAVQGVRDRVPRVLKVLHACTRNPSKFFFSSFSVFLRSWCSFFVFGAWRWCYSFFLLVAGGVYSGYGDKCQSCGQRRINRLASLLIPCERFCFCSGFCCGARLRLLQRVSATLIGSTNVR